MTSYKSFEDTKPVTSVMSVTSVTSVKTDKKEDNNNKKDSVLYKLLSYPLYNRSILRYKL
jgi:hypothetical protein